tara:strand:+ start:4614 stop:5942 length:1329 start_codon:yes stop_codon:yes gene_type:complete
MKDILEVIIIGVVVYLVSDLYKRRVFSLFLCMITYALFSDYIFFMAGYEVGELSIGKMFVEIMFVFVFLIALIDFFKYLRVREHRGINKNVFIFTSFVLFLSLILVFFGSIDNGIVNAVNGWRAIFLPILLVELLLYICPDSMSSESFWRRISLVVVTLSLVNAIYAILQYISYTGHLEDAWRYDLLLEARELRGVNEGLNAHFLQYQIERNSNLRASGFMVSALSFGYFTSLAFVFSIWKLITSSKLLVRLIWLLISVFLFAGIYTSQVRTALIIPLLSFIIFYWINIYRPHQKTILWVTLFSPLFIALGSILLADGLDTSSMGRIIQYSNLLSDFKIFGYGLGSYLGKFDSYYIHILMTIGLFAFIPLSYFVYKLKNLISVSNANANDRSLMIALSLSIVLFSVFFVQHIASSLYYFLSILLISGIVKRDTEKNSFEVGL